MWWGNQAGDLRPPAQDHNLLAALDIIQQRAQAPPSITHVHPPHRLPPFDGMCTY